MARVRFSYSEDHDKSRNQPRKGKRRASTSMSTPFVPGPPPNMNAGFLPKSLSEEQRRELRARQLAAAQFPDPNMPHVSGPLPDHDLHNPEDVTDPRGEYFNQYSPTVNTVFPEIRGPQFTHTKTRTLLDREVHPPLPDFDNPPQVNASLELIAAVSADDREILAFDNKVSNVHMALRALHQAAESMVRSVERQDENRHKEDSVTSHAKNLVRLISTVISPWFNVLEEEFEDLLNETSQVKEMEGEE